MFFFLSCSAPQAPDEYEDLVSYLFAEMANNEEAYPKAGIENLQTWLFQDDGSLVEEGVQLELLSREAVEGLRGESHSVLDLSGVSIITESSYSPRVIADALTQYSFADMMPDTYEIYDRIFSEGQDCIVDGECLWAEAEAYTVADWGLLGKVEAQRVIQFRWVETSQGPVLLQRWWLTEPSEGSSLGLVIHNQYYIGATMPTEEGAVRMHASWLRMELSTGDASEGAANQLISNWKKDAESLDEWISDQE
jgi:hypothetical protein